MCFLSPRCDAQSCQHSRQVGGCLILICACRSAYVEKAAPPISCSADSFAISGPFEEQTVHQNLLLPCNRASLDLSLPTESNAALQISPSSSWAWQMNGLFPSWTTVTCLWRVPYFRKLLPQPMTLPLNLHAWQRASSISFPWRNSCHNLPVCGPTWHDVADVNCEERLWCTEGGGRQKDVYLCVSECAAPIWQVDWMSCRNPAVNSLRPRGISRSRGCGDRCWWRDIVQALAIWWFWHFVVW